MRDYANPYPHRRNEEGSYDSICRNCFATVVRAKSESELAEHEKAHVCDPNLLSGHDRFNRVE